MKTDIVTEFTLNTLTIKLNMYVTCLQAPKAQ